MWTKITRETAAAVRVSSSSSSSREPSAAAAAGSLRTAAPRQRRIAPSDRPYPAAADMEAPLMFEVLMYLNSYYFGMFSMFEFSLICAKSVDEYNQKNVAYTFNEFGTNMTVFVFLCLIEVFRTFLSRRDNAADKAVCVVLSLILTVPSAVGVLYFVLWQKKIFRLEHILGCIQLVLQATQVFFGIVSLLTIKSSDSTT